MVLKFPFRFIPLDSGDGYLALDGDFDDLFHVLGNRVKTNDDGMIWDQTPHTSVHVKFATSGV